MAVVSNLSYTYNESVNARGYPAVHAIAEANQDRTLCGKNPEGWSWLDGTLADVNCKTCLRMMRQESKKTPRRGRGEGMIGPYELNTIYCGECSEMMSRLPADSIPFWLTSPPYDGLRTYKGYTFDFEAIARQLWRITQPGGVGVWVVADETKDGSESGTSFRQALYFMGLGFNLHDTMIYQVEGVGAKGSHKAYWQSFEYMFVFSKGEPKTINLLRDKPNKWAGSEQKNSGHRRFGNGQPKAGATYKTLEMGKRDNVWTYGAGNGKSTIDEIAFDHPAIFPEALARDHILSWSNPGDLVFDPMAGSGTTPKMAYLTGRDFLGFEISEEYCQIARKRLEATMSQPALFNPYQAEIATQPVQLSLEAQITPAGQR